MPELDLNWLRHLKRCELAKKQLTKATDSDLERMIQSFEGSLGSPDSSAFRQHTNSSQNGFQNVTGAQNIYELVHNIAIEWTKLEQRFDRYPAPSDCQIIAFNYDSGLSNLVKAALKIDDIVNGVNALDRNRNPVIQASIQQLQKINSDHAQSVDESFRSADNGVQKVCDAYG
ncbi:MAG: hypothetical protein ACRDF4_01750, partial [Rhabdochlamydiaceae bacterium]